MNRAARLHALLEELRRRGDRGSNAAQLAAQFGVTPRTVKRDIETLTESGSAIEGRCGPGGGYRLIGRATLPPVNFTVPQAVSIALALTAVGDAPFADDGRAALAKLLDVMDADSRARVEELSGRVWVRHDEESDDESGVNRRAIEQALERKCVVSLRYIDGDGAESTRAVEPHLLAHARDRWFVIGWCRTRDAVRWFRLDRIQKATLTKELFVPRETALFGEPPPTARSAADAS
ncbi:transcriptional regulator [Rhodococcus sp. ACPA4]|uniref:HTH domain-containing protein n=2 Tax=Nocardiaceae TaxID=85025 RepID=A0A652YZU4_NOCGL|nr:MULTISPECIES: WYL domain-containing protein [Rhodococcus]NMD58646.1 WYL domain-containing protein [Nocardia globerula]KJF19627.1 HTH domain protein [Rhodococcus sp. AD45]MDV6269413.1 WYL domain-containing protein [Rhodococcus globerulus]MDV8066761.1 WYL domain-containing protein [Rhodococcus sp. IEGM 1366]PBC41335.1 transcriptional regulator [Rhodococcus sp. ACPA4]